MGASRAVCLSCLLRLIYMRRSPSFRLVRFRAPQSPFFAIVEVIVLSTRAGNSRFSTELEKRLHRLSTPLINLWPSMTLHLSTRPVITSILDHPRH